MTDDDKHSCCPATEGDIVISAAVITVSDRSSRGERADESGPAAEKIFGQAAIPVCFRIVVPDDVDAIRYAVSQAFRSGAQLLLLTGGTGISQRDVTPEAIEQLYTRPLPGIGEQLRRKGLEAGASGALLSRASGGVIDYHGIEGIVVAAPGSTGAAKDGAEILAGFAGHAASHLKFEPDETW